MVLVSDAIAAAAVSFAATGALATGRAEGWGLLLGWSVIPRLAAGWLDPPWVSFDKRFGEIGPRVATAIAAFAGLVVGSAALSAIPSIDDSVRVELVLLTLLWLVGFTLGDARAYAAYQPLAWVILLVTALRGSWLTLPLAAVTFAAMALSAALRREPAGAARRGSMRHARSAAAFAAAVFVAALLLARAGFEPLLSSERGADERRPQRREARPDPGPGGAGRSPADLGETDQTVPGRGGSGRVAPITLRGSRGLSGEEIEDEVVLRVDAGFEVRPGTEDARWVPGAGTLWRAWSAVRFDAATQTWVSEAASDQGPPRGSGRTLRRSVPDGQGGSTSWEIAATARGGDAILVPYFASEIQLAASAPTVAGLEESADGDLWWTAVPDAGWSYSARLQPFDALLPFEPPGGAGAPPSPRYLDVPRDDGLDTRLRAIAHRAVGQASDSLASRLARLRAHFTAGFRYATDDGEGDVPESIEEFLAGQRIGDCRHFATAAALLLRTAGVPTRIVGGYAGAERAGDSGTYLVWASSAHAWVEVLTEGGWFPIDPTAWVHPARGRARGPGRASSDEDDATGSMGRDRNLAPALLLAILSSGILLAMVFVLWRRRPKAGSRPPEETSDESAPPVTPEPIAFVPRTRTERLLLDYRTLQADLEGTGQARRDWETPREHGRRVGAAEGPPADGAFDTLVPLIDDGLYGEAEITDGDLETGRRAIDVLRQKLI